ncbi:MAG: twin-arginine translocase TatA/TatE family subunit [Bdellovibrio sp.]
MNLGWTEILLIGGIALLLFGPSKLPGLGRSMGEAIRGFKKGLNEDAPAEKEASEQLAHKPKQPLEHEAASQAKQRDPHES